MPSSNSVEVEVEVGVRRTYLRFRFDFSCCLYFQGLVVGWSEDWRVMLISTQDQIKLKFKFELGNTFNNSNF